MKINLNKKEKYRVMKGVFYVTKTIYFIVSLFIIYFITSTDLYSLFKNYSGDFPINILLFILYGCCFLFLFFTFVVLVFVNMDNYTRGKKNGK